jgi:hypothetical protein
MLCIRVSAGQRRPSRSAPHAQDELKQGCEGERKQVEAEGAEAVGGCSAQGLLQASPAPPAPPAPTAQLLCHQCSCDVGCEAGKQEKEAGVQHQVVHCAKDGGAQALPPLSELQGGGGPGGRGGGGATATATATGAGGAAGGGATAASHCSAPPWRRKGRGEQLLLQWPRGEEGGATAAMPQHQASCGGEEDLCPL